MSNKLKSAGTIPFEAVLQVCACKRAVMKAKRRCRLRVNVELKYVCKILMEFVLPPEYFVFSPEVVAQEIWKIFI